VAAWLGRVLDGEVDPVAGGAVLGGELQPVPEQGVADVDLERVQRGLVHDLVAEIGSAGFGVLEVLAEQLDAFGRGAFRVHVVCGERGDQGDPVLGPGDGDVEAAFPAFG
jgi:hypothetical protein